MILDAETLADSFGTESADWQIKMSCMRVICDIPALIRSCCCQSRHEPRCAGSVTKSCPCTFHTSRMAALSIVVSGVWLECGPHAGRRNLAHATDIEGDILRQSCQPVLSFPYLLPRDSRHSNFAPT
jgi:hypothetical protein